MYTPRGVVVEKGRVAFCYRCLAAAAAAARATRFCWGLRFGSGVGGNRRLLCHARPLDGGRAKAMDRTHSKYNTLQKHRASAQLSASSVYRRSGEVASTSFLSFQCSYIRTYHHHYE